MASEKQILDEVEKTLQAFDNDAVLEENPFLVTRIMAHREHRLHNARTGFAVKIGLNRAVLLLVLLINLATAVYFYEWNMHQKMQAKLVSGLKQEFQIDQSQDLF